MSRCLCGGEMYVPMLSVMRANVLAKCAKCDRQYRLVYIPDDRHVRDIPLEHIGDYEVRG